MSEIKFGDVFVIPEKVLLSDQWEGSGWEGEVIGYYVDQYTPSVYLLRKVGTHIHIKVSEQRLLQKFENRPEWEFKKVGPPFKVDDLEIIKEKYDCVLGTYKGYAASTEAHGFFVCSIEKYYEYRKKFFEWFKADKRLIYVVGDDTIIYRAFEEMFSDYEEIKFITESEFKLLHTLFTEGYYTSKDSVLTFGYSGPLFEIDLEKLS